MTSPFDLRSALLAKHAQHVILIHFPIALYIAGTLFDFFGRAARKPALHVVAHWNHLAAALFSIPAAITGILAWRFALEGQSLKGILRLHLIFGLCVVAGLWILVWLRSRYTKSGFFAPPRFLLVAEWVFCGFIALTAHLGGFLSGVNGGG